MSEIELGFAFLSGVVMGILLDRWLLLPLVAQLAAQLDAELEVGQADGEEPALPKPRPDGVLASAL